MQNANELIPFFWLKNDKKLNGKNLETYKYFCLVLQCVFVSANYILLSIDHLYPS